MPSTDTPNWRLAIVLAQIAKRIATEKASATRLSEGGAADANGTTQTATGKDAHPGGT